MKKHSITVHYVRHKEGVSFSLVQWKRYKSQIFYRAYTNMQVFSNIPQFLELIKETRKVTFVTKWNGWG